MGGEEDGRRGRRVAMAAVGAAAVGLGGYLLYRRWWSTGKASNAGLCAEAEKLKGEGNSLFKQKKYPEALARYTEALELEPKGYVLYSNRSITLIKMDKFEEALENASICIECMPTFARGYERKARALKGLGRIAEGLEVCEQGLKNAKPNEVASLLQLQEDLKNPSPPIPPQPSLDPVNRAFVFIKPHAVTERVQNLVIRDLTDKGFRVVTQGALLAAEIDKKQLIDQHYYAIASKATILKPHQLPVPADKFEDKFGLSWENALGGGRVFNATDGCADLKIDADAMNELWAACKKAGNMIKFGGGFYCGRLELEGKEPAYVFNGFFMSMRSKYTAPDASIYYYEVEWPKSLLSWEDFRGQVLGPTDPHEAPETSLRGKVLAQWKELGLASEPNVGDNGVHASASPFEALAERMNWLGYSYEDDPFGKELKAAGVGADVAAEWAKDPQVMVPGQGNQSLFDSLEDMDADAVVHKCKAIMAAA